MPRKNTKGTWGRYGLFGTLPEAFLVSGNYQIRRKRIFVSYEWKRIFVSSQETSFCFQEPKFRFLESRVVGEPIAESRVVGEPSFLGYCTAWPCPTTRFFQYLQATGWHCCWCSTLRLSEIAGCAACAPMREVLQPCAVFGWHSHNHPEAHWLPQ